MNKNRKTLLVALIALGLAVAFLRCGRRTQPEPPPNQPQGEFQTQGRLQIYALDVGQGDSLLIISPGGKHVLIDAGPVKAGDEVVAALAQHQVSNLDLAVATHPHADHIGGMLRVLRNVPVKNFLDSGQDYTTASYERMIGAIRDKNITFIDAKRGQSFDLDSGVKLEVLNPQGGDWITQVRPGASVQNANSVVLRLSYGNFAMVFTGDAEAETEAVMLQNKANLRAQILKVGHHGSRYATSNDFLRAVRPEAAIISCGADNRYGHPTQETLDRLNQDKVRIYRTDLQGEVAISSDGKSFQVKPARQAEALAVLQGRHQTAGE